MPRPHFYFNGCSFTEGAELENKEENRFSKLIARHFNAVEVNEARGGGSNYRIVRMFVDAISKQRFKHVFIMWTSLDRYEHWAGREDGGYDTVTFHRLFPEQAPETKGVWNHQKQYVDRPKILKGLQEYTLNVRTDNQCVADFLSHVLTVQTMCKLSRTPYTMTSYQNKRVLAQVDKVINSTAKENPQEHEYLLEKFKLIDWDNWLQHKNFGFLEMSEANNFPIGLDGHPLQEAQKQIATLAIRRMELLND